MVGMVRCKMTAQRQNGAAGSIRLWFNAVYEGSSELQKISENAIFGDASPSGSAHIDGSQEILGRFDHDEEYYIDFREGGGTKIGDGAPDVLLVVDMKRSFRSAPNPNFPDHNEFRYVRQDLREPCRGFTGGCDARGRGAHL